MGLKCQKVNDCTTYLVLYATWFPFLLFLIFIFCYADNFILQSAERFDYLLNVLNNGSTSDDNPRHTDTNYADQDRYISTLNYHNATCKLNIVPVAILLHFLQGFCYIFH